MPEFRQNLVTGEWVILAQERAKRPHDHGAERSRCPFCPGNEERTPDPVLVVDGDAVLGCDWAIRVVPNKFPALTPEGTPTEGHVGPYSTMTGVGAHDVVVESPVHDDGLATYAVEHLARVLGVWAERHNQLFRDPRFKYVQILKNHGQGSGASLGHPHSQIIAVPFVPAQVDRELIRAEEYHRSRGTCMLCDLIEHEMADGNRIVYSNDAFIAVTPFASKMPFEMWILPMAHSRSFGQLDQGSALLLADALRAIANGLRRGWGDPPFNLVVHTSAPADGPAACASYHWRIDIVPRLVSYCGFEMGTGVFINAAIPEDAARYLRALVSADAC